MKNLESIKAQIDDRLDDCGTSSDIVKELSNTKLWLEGWICGVTDILHPEFIKYKDEAMEYLIQKHLQWSSS